MESEDIGLDARAMAEDGDSGRLEQAKAPTTEIGKITRAAAAGQGVHG